MTAEHVPDLQDSLFEEVEPVQHEPRAPRELGSVAMKSPEQGAPASNEDSYRSKESYERALALIDKEHDKHCGRLSYEEVAESLSLGWALGSSAQPEAQPQGVFCGDCGIDVQPGHSCGHIAVSQKRIPYANDQYQYGLVGRRPR